MAPPTKRNTKLFQVSKAVEQTVEPWHVSFGRAFEAAGFSEQTASCSVASQTTCHQAMVLIEGRRRDPHLDLKQFSAGKGLANRCSAKASASSRPEEARSFLCSEDLLMAQDVITGSRAGRQKMLCYRTTDLLLQAKPCRQQIGDELLPGRKAGPKWRSSPWAGDRSCAGPELLREVSLRGLAMNEASLLD